MELGSINPQTGQVEMLFINRQERVTAQLAATAVGRDFMTKAYDNGTFETCTCDAQADPRSVTIDALIRLSNNRACDPSTRGHAGAMVSEFLASHAVVSNARP